MKQQLLISEMNALLAQHTDDVPQLTQEVLAGLYAMGYQFYRNGKYQDSQRFFRFLTLVDQRQQKFWMGLGASYQMLKEYPAAIDAYKQATVLDDKDPYSLWHTAECLRHINEKDEALKTLNCAINITKQSEDYHDLRIQFELIFQAWQKTSEGDAKW